MRCASSTLRQCLVIQVSSGLWSVFRILSATSAWLFRRRTPLRPSAVSCTEVKQPPHNTHCFHRLGALHVTHTHTHFISQPSKSLMACGSAVTQPAGMGGILVSLFAPVLLCFVAFSILNSPDLRYMIGPRVGSQGAPSWLQILSWKFINQSLVKLRRRAFEKGSKSY